MEHSNKRLSISTQQMLLILAFAQAPLSSFVSGVLYHIPIISSFSSYVYPAILIMLVGLNAKAIVKRIRASDFIWLLLLFLAILLSYLFNPNNQPYIVDAMPELFGQIIPFFVFGLFWDSDEKMFDYIYYTSCIAIIVNIFYFVFFTAARGDLNYSMSTAYAILPSTMVCTWYFIKEKRKQAIICTVIGCAMLLFLGTRGPVVIQICYIVVLLWRQANLKKRILLLLIGALLIYFVVFSDVYQSLLLQLSIFARSRGMSARLFDILGRGEMFSYTSGRDQFYEIVRNMIRERPFLGYGIYGERPFLGDAAHRIWLEIWSHYGVIIGTFLMLAMVYTIYKGIKSAPNDKMRQFIMLWAIHLGIRGIFGSDYLSYYSALLFGLCINSIRDYKPFKQYIKIL